MAWSALPTHFFIGGMALAVFALAFLILVCIASSWRPRWSIGPVETLSSYCQFFYVSFLKPHRGDKAGHGQQAALESFYKAQVRVPLHLIHQ